MWSSLIALLYSVHFQHPGWLWGYPLSLVVIGLLLRAHGLHSLARLPEWSGIRRYRHPRMNILSKLHQQQNVEQLTRGSLLRWIEYAVLLLCIHVTLAQPFRQGQQFPTPPEYRDTVFVIDASLSMSLRDYLVAGKRTQRITILKSVLTHFIEQLKGNRIGLVVFSEKAYTLAPLTADYGLLKYLVRRLQPATITGRTTDISKGLLYTLRQLQQSNSKSAAQKPVLVLITDVDRSSRTLDPRVIAAYVHAQGYRLYTIGIGAPSYAAKENTPTGLIYQPANFALLKQIAKRGGGQFYWAKNVDSLQSAINAIQSNERRQAKVITRFVTIPLYQWPLLLGLTWILLLQLWTSRSRRA